ncbi:MAG: hypothetical protein A2231_12675 [Candidatus Firestonebacteria bacterium RIFOXYA2_FULL_40_8]|nr:MAG: hypothetical protein A2231_12675 [Candidatus Firestonebacteria bacterium RIFOXYA2_FULL_40_8]
MLRSFVVTAMLICLSNTAIFCAQWSNIGLGGGGSIHTPAISPVDGNFMLASCDMSGVYRTLDGGVTWGMIDWQQINSSNGCTDCWPVVYPVCHPTDANIVYFWGKKGNTAAALLVSNDKGVTWNPLVNTPPWGSNVITKIYVDRGNPNLMFAGTATNAYRSTNAGVSWSVCATVSGSIVGFLVDQASSTSNRTCYAASTSGVWRSKDHGASWTSKITGLPATPTLRSFSGGSTLTKTVLYCVETTSYDVYKSTTNGDSWVSVMGGTIDGSLEYFQVITAEAYPDTVYVNDFPAAYDGKVYKSTDAGVTWQQVWSPSISGGNVELGWIDYEIHLNPPSRGFTINPANANQVVGSRTVNYMTINGGTSWKQLFTKYADTGAQAVGKKWSSKGL